MLEYLRLFLQQEDERASHGAHVDGLIGRVENKDVLRNHPLSTRMLATSPGGPTPPYCFVAAL
jgi:hypothetical protein